MHSLINKLSAHGFLSFPFVFPPFHPLPSSQLLLLHSWFLSLSIWNKVLFWYSVALVKRIPKHTCSDFHFKTHWACRQAPGDKTQCENILLVFSNYVFSFSLGIVLFELINWMKRIDIHSSMASWQSPWWKHQTCVYLGCVFYADTF